MKSKLCRDKADLYNCASNTEKFIFYYATGLWILEIISFILKVKFYSTYSDILDASSIGSEFSHYTLVLFCLDISLIVFYAIFLIFVTRESNFVMIITTITLFIVFAFRLFYGLYFLFDESKIETDIANLDEAMKMNFIFEVCLEICIIPPAVVGGIIICLASLKTNY